jgi:hypothetical protein
MAGVPHVRDDTGERIARIRRLLEQLRDCSDETREEALVATEQLLEGARRKYEETAQSHRLVHRHVALQRLKTRRKRKR